MRFEFCGNLDCPEWVLSEVAILNRISAIKLKLMLAQIVKKLTGQDFDQEKLQKLCRDQKFDIEETKVCIALIEFLLGQAIKYQVTDKVFSKDLLQMGVAIENANGLVKVFAEQSENIGRVMKENSFRVSQIQGLQYSLSYLVATSMGGSKATETGTEPIDMTVSMNIDLKEYPKIKSKPLQHNEEEAVVGKASV